MTTQSDLATQFASLHKPGNPLILCNFWDPGSALLAQTAGARALATGSHSLSGALGFDDGEACPLDMALWVLKRSCDVTSVPVSHDLERGFGVTADEVAKSCTQVVDAGAVGVNIEDSLPDGSLRSIEEQSARLSAAHRAISTILPDGVINARCDVFFRKDTTSDEQKLAAVLSRAKAYRMAGANSLFVPGLSDIDLIGKLCAAAPLPVNIMRKMNGPATSSLAKAGVARISHGPFPYIKAMTTFTESAQQLYAPA